MFEYDNLIDLDKRRKIKNFKKSKQEKTPITSIHKKSGSLPFEWLLIPILIVFFIAVLSAFMTIAK